VDALITVTVYDAAGHVTGYRHVPLPDDQLTSGGSTSFDVVIAPDPSVPDVASFVAVAQARAQ
jgi:hypothetical protein